MTFLKFDVILTDFQASRVNIYAKQSPRNSTSTRKGRRRNWQDEGSDEAEKCKTIVECDEIRAISEELKDQMEDGEKNEVVIGDDGNWKRAKKRDDEDEEGKIHVGGHI